MTHSEALTLMFMISRWTFVPSNDQRYQLDMIELGYRAAFDLAHRDDEMWGRS